MFVGYSHNDPVMRYLARGLPPGSGSRRYALTEEGRDDHWRYLGIKPISYAIRPNAKDPHEALTEGVTEWAAFGQLGALDHERRIQALVAASPPLEPETVSYVPSVPTSVRHFAP